LESINGDKTLIANKRSVRFEIYRFTIGLLSTNNLAHVLWLFFSPKEEEVFFSHPHVSVRIGNSFSHASGLLCVATESRRGY
jgi:hypothetical protein